MAPPVSPTPATLPPPRPAPSDAETPVKAWLASFNALISSGKTDVSSLFLEDSFWRDHLCLTFTPRTAHTQSAISSLLSSGKLQSITLSASRANPIFVAPVDATGEVPAACAFVDVKTTVGHGIGIIKLLEDLSDDRAWKAYTVFTVLLGLDAYPEKVGKQRPHGVLHGANPTRKNWMERRAHEREFLDEQPVVVIIGAGQGGLVAAARLKMLGIPTLVVDKNDRVGDNWRKRYHHLVLHDPVQYDHLPYMPFPPFWPTFTPKDKLGDWFESYASALELNVWTSSTVSSSVWDAAANSWTLTITGPRGPRIVTPRHLVLATGHSGEPDMPSIPGMSEFQGSLLCHSSAFQGAKADGKGRKALVVGCCNSGHDIAQDYWEKGYDVTIIQRSSTYVMSSEHGLSVLLKGLYDEDGPPTDDADLIFMSIPIAVFKRNQIEATKEIGKRDAAANEALTKAGFKLDTGPHDSGFVMKYLERGGGYYLDVGASAIIASGGIKLKQGHEVTRVLAKGLEFDDGTVLEADEIVFATGYSNMVSTARKILGDQALDGVEDVWGVDAETGEMRGMWKKVGGRRLWFMGGNLAFTRWFSRCLALGIAADEAGLV